MPNQPTYKAEVAARGVLLAVLLSLLIPEVAFAQRVPPGQVPPADTKPPADRKVPLPAPLPPPDVEGAPGVINRKGDKPLDKRFDPKTLGRTKDLPKPEDQNVIEVTKNYGDKYPCKRIPLDAMVSIDFQNLKLEDFTKLMACMTGKRFMLSQGVSGQITIMSPEPVTMYEAWKAFLSALEANNLTIVKRGKFLRVVPKAKARTEGAPILSGRQGTPSNDTVVTQLIAVKHIMADEAKELIQNFATDGADISVYAPSNTLIITEVASNIPRLRKLIRQIDRPTGASKIWVRPVEFAEVGEIAKQIETVFGKNAKGKSSKSSRPSRPASRNRSKTKNPAKPATGGSLGNSNTEMTVTPDERTNQLIIITDRTTYLQIDKFIRKIDVPIPGEGQIHIHHLENAAAKDVQTTLQALTGGGRNSSRRSSSRKSKTSSKSKGSSKSTAAATIGDDVKITAHEPTNSLVIEASLKDYLTLRRVIRQLDVRRKQVYLESVIMEITSDKNREVGVKGFGGASFDIDGQEVPLIFGNGVPDISSITDAGGGLGAMLLGPLIDASLGSAGAVAGQSSLSIPAFGFTLKALQSNSDVNILQTPHILTTDNEEAEIEVGRRVPFNSTSGGLGGLGSLAGLSGLGLGGAGGAAGALGGLGLGGALGGLGGIGSVQFVDVKLSLKIKPTVNESSFVRLEIEQQIDDFDGIDSRTNAPNTSNRRVKNIVVVRDQQPVVIGGLMNDREVEGSQKIPILGDIPLLGVLFRQSTTRVERKNLLMVIIPHIIDDPSDLKRIHEQRMDEIRRFAEFLATRKKEYMGQINYEKKHGLMHQMHKVVERARAERYQLEQQLFDDSELDPVGPADTHDLEYDPYEIETRRQEKSKRPGKRKRGSRSSK